MEILPEEMLNEILNHLPKVEYHNLYRANRTFHRLCLQRTTPITDFETGRNCIQNGDILSLMNSQWRPHGNFKSAGRLGSLAMVKLLIYKGGYSLESVPKFYARGGVNLTSIFKGACQSGHQGLIDFLIAKGITDWSLGLMQACKGGQMAVVQDMLKRGATTKFTSCLYYACRSGHLELSKLMFTKTMAYNQAIKGACQGGYKPILDWLFTKWNQSRDWSTADAGLKGACLGGHKEIAMIMINRGANDWNSGLEAACRGGHRELSELMIEKGATNFRQAFDICEDSEIKELLRSYL